MNKIVSTIKKIISKVLVDNQVVKNNFLNIILNDIIELDF